MKQHITRANVARTFTHVIFCNEIGNIAYDCGLSPEYYNAGSYGWNWDIYTLGGGHPSN